VEMMASLEAWMGDPPLVRTPVSFAASIEAWAGDPLVRDATAFAADLILGMEAEARVGASAAHQGLEMESSCLRLRPG
jgi:hypothetical protein